MDVISNELVRALAVHGFREVPRPAESVPDAQALLRRQTLNMNRAVVVLTPAQMPRDIPSYLNQVRRRAAFRCKFVPVLWGLGLQLVIVLPGIAAAKIDPAQYVSKVDNQWAIIQSLFLVDPDARRFRFGRTWGHTFTGKYQDAIVDVLKAHFAEGRGPAPNTPLYPTQGTLG